MLEKWAEQFILYMPHIHCFGYDWNLAYQNIVNDAFTVTQYIIIAFMFFHVATWGTKGANWYKLCRALGWVFIFCSANYAMNVWVVFEPVYYLQVGIKTIGNAIFLKAVYHLLRIGKTPLIALVNSLKGTIKQAGF